MDKQEVRITVRLPKDLHARLSEAAKESDRSLHGQIIHLLKKALDEKPS